MKEMLNLSQQDYVKRIEELNQVLQLPLTLALQTPRYYRHPDNMDSS